LASRKVKALFALIALVTAVPCAARADVLYENPWNSITIDAGSFSQDNQRLAGEFTLSTGAIANRADMVRNDVRTGSTGYWRHMVLTNAIRIRTYLSQAGLKGLLLAVQADGPRTRKRRKFSELRCKSLIDMSARLPKADSTHQSARHAD